MKSIWNFITALKNTLGNLIFIAIIVLIVVAIFSRDTPDVPESAAMIIHPEGIIVEQLREVEPLRQLLEDEDTKVAETLGRDIKEAIELAADDDRIKALVLSLSDLAGSTLAQYDSIGKALNNFKKTGKPVYAFGSSYSQSQYYLASFADTIYIDKDSLPSWSGVFLQGFGAYPLFMKSALDKLRVSMNLVRVGEYKSAGEIFIRDDMSEYSKEATREVLDFLWDSYVEKIAEHRGISRRDIARYIDNYDSLLSGSGLDGAQLAVDEGLVDALISRTEWRVRMQGISGTTEDTYHHIDHHEYLAATRQAEPVEKLISEQIAVIVAKGEIVPGSQPAGSIGGDSMAKLIRRARNNDDIKAIVLRIDSPGGSAAASELIRSELAATQAVGKPVIASMGGSAASGGYWIAATADRIISGESTITGSIGVFALFPTFERSLDYLGLHSDGVGTTALSGSFNNFAEINPAFRRTLNHSVSHVYQKFLSLVSVGRGMTVEEVDAVARGRIWTGAMALEYGLVDAIGDLDDAIESAADLADVTDYRVVYLEKELSPREQFIKELLERGASMLPPLASEWVVVVPPEVKSLTRMAKEPAIYSQCLDCRITF